MTRKRMLFISSFFPNPSAPNIATYVRHSLVALAEHYDIDAVVPVPWLSRLRSGIPRAATFEGIEVRYPAYYYTPLVFRNLYGLFFYHSIAGTLDELQGNNYDLVHSAWLYPDGWVAAKVARSLGLPLFVYVLGSDVNRLRRGHFLTARMLEVAACAQKIVCVSNPMKEKLMALGCEPGKLVYLQNGIDHGLFRPMDRDAIRPELGIEPADRIILYVGHLLKEKGLAELAEAFGSIADSGRHPGAKLVVIGSGRYRSSLVRELARLGVADRATLLGECSPGTVAKYMNACDVLCLPSHSEGEPNVVIEALACHAKVVATRVGGTPDLDPGDGNLKLVEPRAVPALTDALMEMLDRKGERWGRSMTRSWQSHALEMRKIFEGCCQSSPQTPLTSGEPQ